MQNKSLKISVSSAIGKVSARCLIPDKPKCIITFAHGAGAGMDHIFMETMAYKLADEGIATLRFNFPFTENKKGRPDSPAVAHQTIEAAIIKARELLPKLPVFASGKSFGGRMSSQYLAINPGTEVKGVIFFGFPLHQVGNPSTDRAEHLTAIKVPMLFLQGTKDALASWDLIEKVCKTLKKAKLVKIDGADHSFKAGKRDTLSELTAAVKDWVQKL
jgi:predicted alpha/beta-hydrolase family hydrolase